MSIKTCKNCTERTIEPNCHDTCEKYLSAVKAKRELQEKIRKIKMNQTIDRRK